jgi:predicted nuclease of predicted toxin-antitoxin system
MKFLLNVNLPRDLGRRLAATGHQCRHAADIGLAHAIDETIVSEARRCQETILTHDLDYGRILAFSAQRAPSVLIFRLRDPNPELIFRRLVDSWPNIEEPLGSGAIVSLEDAAVRIRKLPIVVGEE